MGGTCSTYEGKGGAYIGFCWGNLRERFHLQNPGVDGRMIIQSWIFRKWNEGVWTGWRWLRIGTGSGHL